MDVKISLTGLDLFVICLYLIVLLAIGFGVSFRKKHSNDLFLAGRSLGWFNIGLSIFGTNISPSMMISSAGVAYASGMVASNMEWLAWLFLMLLSMVFLPHYLNTKISTMPEFLLTRFGPACRSFLSWYTLFCIVVMWLGGVLYAGGLLVSQLMGWPIWLSVVLLVAVATSFTITGGLEAIAITDSYQSILIILGSTMITVIAFLKIGSFDNLINSVPPDYWTLFRPASDSKFPWHAILLGYPVSGIWFWCTDQTIVQRVLGGRDARQGQLGCILAAYLKVVVPFIFFVPGILCKVLYPNLSDPDRAYMTLVSTCLPSGAVGLIVAILIAALISTVDAALNSFSTVFTLDIYCHKFKPNASVVEQKKIGQIVTFLIAVISIFMAIIIATIPDKSLFEKLLAIMQFLAPPLAAVFIVGILWKSATSASALMTLIFGSIVSIGTGICYLAGWPSPKFYPHFMLLSFYIFIGLVIFMIVISLFTRQSSNINFPTLIDAIKNTNAKTGDIWIHWLILGLIMVTLYVVFN